MRRGLLVARHLRLRLVPAFGGRRLAGITSAEVTRYIARRQPDTIVTRKAHAQDVETDSQPRRREWQAPDEWNLEAPPGFEPGMELLQSSALPLGDGAARNKVTRFPAAS